MAQVWFRQAQSIHHLTRLEPAIVKEGLLRDVRQNGISAAKSNNRRFTKENTFFEQSVVPPQPEPNQSDWRQPQD